MLSLPVLNLLISTAGDLFIADGSIISQNTSKYHYTRLSSTTLLAIFPLWFILFRLHHKNNKFLSCSHWLGDTGFCLSTQLILVILITATPSPAELSQCSWFQVQWEDNSYYTHGSNPASAALAPTRPRCCSGNDPVDWWRIRSHHYISGYKILQRPSCHSRGSHSLGWSA